MNIRPVKSEDLKELCSILNEIIDIGGTTAYETQLQEHQLDSHFVSGKDCICCFVAEEKELLLGFQALSHHADLDEGWVNITTFARVKPKVSGVGTSLFASSKSYARQNEIKHINATIRADNISGLAYYDKMGFKDYSVAKNVPLLDGTPIDRISKYIDVDH